MNFTYVIKYVSQPLYKEIRFFYFYQFTSRKHITSLQVDNTFT